MSQSEVMMDGTLRPDGTLDLDQKPNLPPGRVTVVLRQKSEPAASQDDWWQFMQRSRKELEATGQSFLNEQQVRDHIEWLRQADQVDEQLAQMEINRHKQGPS